MAAEFLVPQVLLEAELRGAGDPLGEVDRLRRYFKVSSLVVLRRLLDIRALDARAFRRVYDAELERLLGLPQTSGGNFYLSQVARVSRRFARALIGSTLEGQTLHRDACRMLGVRRAETFEEFARAVGGGA